MPDPKDLYKDLEKALKDFRTFLDTNVPIIKPAVKPLDQILGGRVIKLIDKLIALMEQLKNEINNLNVSALPGLKELSDFTGSVKTVLETAKNLLPNQAANISDVLEVVDVVSGLPSLGTVKTSIIDEIALISSHLKNLKP